MHKKELKTTGNRMISAYLPENLYLEGKNTGYKWESIIRAGIQMMNGNPQFVNRIRELEQENEKRKQDYYSLRKRFIELETLFLRREEDKCSGKQKI